MHDVVAVLALENKEMNLAENIQYLKEAKSYNDCFDAFRLSLMFWH